MTDTWQNAQKQDDLFARKLQNLEKKHSYMKGFSQIYQSQISFQPNWQSSTVPHGADVSVYDEATFSDIRLPLSRGTWPEAKLDDGKIPCLIGGAYAGRYKVGDVISGYIPKKSDLQKLEKSRDYVVKGVLSVPQLSLKTRFSSTNIDAASIFFNDMTNRALFMIVPENLYSGANMGGSGLGGAFLYLDRSCTQAQIDGLRDEMNRGYTQLDTEIIAEEQAQNGSKCLIIARCRQKKRRPLQRPSAD